MIIAIPVDERKENVCVSFGRAPYFLLHNTETQKSKTVEYPAPDAQGGAASRQLQFVIDTGANILIAVCCGQNTADVFKATNIKVYKAMGGSAEDQLKAFVEGKLDELTSFHRVFTVRRSALTNMMRARKTQRKSSGSVPNTASPLCAAFHMTGRHLLPRIPRTAGSVRAHHGFAGR